MTPLRATGIVLTVLGLLVVGAVDWLTATPEEGTPVGFLVLPLGGVLAMAGLALVARSSAGPTQPEFTEEELDRMREERRRGEHGGG